MDPKVMKFLMAYIESTSVIDAAHVSGLTRTQGNNIIKKKDVQEALKLIWVEVGRQNNFDNREILERTNEIAQVDPIDLFKEDGTVKAISDMPGHARRAIKKLVVREVWEKDINGMDTFTGYIKHIELHDKIKANELIGKNEGLFKETIKHEHEIGNNFAKLLLGSEKRANEIDVTPKEVLNLSGDAYKDQFAIAAAKTIKDE